MPKKMGLKIAIIWIAGTHLSCGSRIYNSEVKLTGGQEIDESHSYAKHSVAILKEIKQTGEVISICSGALLDTGLIVSAAHCFDSINDSRLFAYFGNQSPSYNSKPQKLFFWSTSNQLPVPVDDILKDPKARPIKSVVMPKKFLDGHEQGIAEYRYGGWDLAVAHFETSIPVPVGVQPVRLIDEKYRFKKGDKLVIASYGRGSNGENSGRLRSIETKFLRLKESGDAGSRYIISEGTSSRATCNGDSGGPVFIEKDQELILAGIVNLVRDDCTGYGSNIDLRWHLDWLNEQKTLELEFTGAAAIKDSGENVIYHFSSKRKETFEKYCANSERTLPEKTALLELMSRFTDKNEITLATCIELAEADSWKIYRPSKQSELHPKVSTIEPLARWMWANNGKRIRIFNGDISDISSLSEIASLREINLENQLITNLNPIKRLFGLKHLNLSYNPISEFKPIEKLYALNILKLNYSGIRTIDSLSALYNLYKLELEGNELTDIQPLVKIGQLHYLDLSHNLLTDIRPLSNHKKLREINLSHNKISDISEIGDFNSLRTLDLSHNQITDIKPLAKLKSLRKLILKGNPISETEKICPFKPVFGREVCVFD